MPGIIDNLIAPKAGRTRSIAPGRRRSHSVRFRTFFRSGTPLHRRARYSISEIRRQRAVGLPTPPRSHRGRRP
jgi:hypothetical protein